MTRVLSAVSAIVVVLSSSIASAQTISAPPAYHADQGSIAQRAENEESQRMLAMALAFLEDRNQQLMADGRPHTLSAAQNLSKSMSARVERDNAALRELRDRLSRLGESYTGFKTDTRLIEAQQIEGKTLARVEETSRFDYARIRGDEPAYTAFRVEREFTFSQQNGVWVIEDVRLLDQTGLAPINEVVTAAAPSFKQLMLPPAGAADLSKFNLTPETRESFMKEPVRNAGVASLDYGAMANYAITWALGRNPSYRSFPNDCTNFISQAMLAGGWTMVEGWYQSDSVWWYNIANQSYTWAGAENWYWFANGSGRTTMLENVWYMGIADVLQMDFERDNNINHSMMVTQMSETELYLSYHSTDTLNRSLSSIIASYPSAWYYAHRT